MLACNQSTLQKFNELILLAFNFSLLVAFIFLSFSLIGAEKSGKNAEGDSWWETWQEVLYQDEWRCSTILVSFQCCGAIN